MPNGLVVYLISGYNNVSIAAGGISISGNVISISPTTSSSVLTGGFVTVTNSSGGTQLSSGSINSVTVINLSGNQPMLVGGIGQFAPSASFGGIMYGGGAMNDIQVDNLNKVRVFATASGQQVSFFATGG